MKKSHGSTLVEAVMALFVLSIVIPASLGALGGVLTADFKINEMARTVSSSEWWFSRLTLPVSMENINAAPREDPYGRARFEWETENLSGGAIRVTLRVYERLSGPVFSVSRIF